MSVSKERKEEKRGEERKRRKGERKRRGGEGKKRGEKGACLHSHSRGGGSCALVHLSHIIIEIVMLCQVL